MLWPRAGEPYSDPDEHGMLLSPLIGTGFLQLKVTKISSVPKKALKMNASSTVHSLSAISCNSSGEVAIIYIAIWTIIIF